MLPFLAASSGIDFISMETAITGSFSGSLSINKPSSVSAGNLLVLITFSNSDDFVTNSGIVESTYFPSSDVGVQMWDDGSGTDNDKVAYVSFRIATGTEPSSFSLTPEVATSNAQVGAVLLNFTPPAVISGVPVIANDNFAFSNVYGTSPESFVATASTLERYSGGLDLIVARLGVRASGTSSAWSLTHGASGFSTLYNDHFSTVNSLSCYIGWRRSGNGVLESVTFTGTDIGAGTETMSIAGGIVSYGENNA